MSTLLIDNYDSYTYNVFHLLAAACGEEPIVVHNDMVSWKALSRWDFDAIVLSPGPGRPDRWHDFGVCSDILRSSEVPVLGVCLGHQGLGHVLKANVTYAPTVMHGRLSPVKHSGVGLFDGIPQDFDAVRYHSLAVSGSLGEEGREIAWTEDGVVMGIEHAHRPLWGVQFHPESICTEHGHKLFENFYALARQHRPKRSGRRLNRPSVPPRRCRRRSAEDSQVSLHVRTIEGEAETEYLFEALFGQEDYAFWLDSASTATQPGADGAASQPGADSAAGRPGAEGAAGRPGAARLADQPTPARTAGRLAGPASDGQLGQRSFMGASLGANRLVLEYDVDAGIVTRHGPTAALRENGSIFQVLERELEARTIEPPEEPAKGLIGGFVGYLGYECKGDCGASNTHSSDVPDAVQIFANRVIAVDHTTGRTYAMALCQGEEPDALQWLDRAERAAREALTATPSDLEETGTNVNPPSQPVIFRPGRGREQYLADIARAQSALGAGESYEVCLTDQIHTDAAPDPWLLYRGLRRSNPAPFAAYLKLGEVAVVSSSPERFLSVDRERKVMARPIKGTAPRATDPFEDEATRKELQEDEKTFAEHLMIVDLLRNDLGRVCEVDSVRVPELMRIEQYATVHQMISNVVGTLEPGRSPIDCVRACFPGGSMTGAPKLRTMEIIDDIEREARGVYSGAIGYFGADGVVDLSIVIRTVVIRPGGDANRAGGGANTTTIGAGGAIVMQSDPEEEFAEILLKARAPMAAIAKAFTGSDSPEAWVVELEPAALAGSAS
jgi:para-aminobenzoate synthetase